MKALKHLLAWLSIFVCYLIVAILASLAMSFVAFIVMQVGKLSLVTRLFIYLVGGTTLLGIALAPLHFGPAITAAVSESIYPSANGTRYIVFATIQITLSALSFVLNLIAGHLNIAILYTVLYSIFLIIYGKEFSNDKDI